VGVVGITFTVVTFGLSQAQRRHSGSPVKIPIAITKAQNVVRGGGNAADESLVEVVDYREGTSRL
jgi:hypothetical protein